MFAVRGFPWRGWLLVAASACLIACATAETPTLDAPDVDLLRRRGVRIVPETRSLDLGRHHRRHLLRGWLGNEWNPELGLHFVWASGTRSEIGFDLLQVLEQQFLVELSPYPTPHPQRIRVLVNDEPVTTFEAEPGYREYRFVVPETHLRLGRNVLAFEHSEVGPPPRRPAAAYAWILHGPNCLRLRPKGRPEPAPGLTRTDDAWLVRGPAALSWRLRPAPDAELRLQVEAPSEPFTLAVDVVEGHERTRLGEARVTAPWFSGRPSALRFDLSPWRDRRIRLRLEVLPDACRSAATTARISQAGLFSAR